MSTQKKTLGLYIHIPFCSFMCHYCDFAKTANWDATLISEYMEGLKKQLEFWLTEYVEKQNYTIDTLFLGGGTPGLLDREYEGLFEVFSKYNIQFQEATIEVNPENITDEKLKIWKSLGFSRLSMGVQSFQEKGLKALTRQHSREQLFSALEKAQSVFDNVNCDLIYAWPGQTLEDWKADLEIAESLDLSHLSLYCLTLEEKTPFGRAHSRGVFASKNDEFQEQCYEYARKFLQKQSWEHYECSNWSRKGKNCVHNAKYWQDQCFIGVGAGACGYVPEGNIGMRYAYTRKERLFTKNEASFEVDPRDAQDWLTEYVGCGLRYKEGLDLDRIASKTGLEFRAEGLVKKGLEEGKLRLEASRLYLDTNEWFRETRWCLELLRCFYP